MISNECVVLGSDYLCLGNVFILGLSGQLRRGAGPADGSEHSQDGKQLATLSLLADNIKQLTTHEQKPILRFIISKL